MLLLIFDWGGTVMMDYREEGPMYQWDRVDYVPGIKNALVELSGEYKCCIATNADYSGRDALIMALKRVGAEKYFSNFFTSKDLGYEKPDKRFFLSIAKERPGICLLSCHFRIALSTFSTSIPCANSWPGFERRFQICQWDCIQTGSSVWERRR